MRHINILDVNLYHIQLFLEVAEKENITRVANCNHVSQSMLSKLIKNMEQTFGLQLFFRNKGNLHLTPAGKILKEEFMATIGQIESAIERAHDCQKVQSKSLIIGFQDSFNPQKVITPLVKQYLQFDSNFRYNEEACEYKNLPKKLLSKEIDIAFTSLFEIPSFLDNELEYYVVEKFHLQAFMLTTNPLSNVDFLTFDMLRQQNFIVISASVNPNYIMNVINPLSEKYGFTPHISYYASSAKSIASNLHNDNEVFVADKYNAEADVYDHVAKDIQDSESGVIMAWRKGSNDYIMDFINFIKKTNKIN